MICPECGHEGTGNFCSFCGALLSGGEAYEDDIFSGSGQEDVKEADETGDFGGNADGARGRSRRNREQAPRSGGKDHKTGAAKTSRAEKKAEKADKRAEKSAQKLRQEQDERIEKQLKESAKQEKLLNERLEQLYKEQQKRPGDPDGRERDGREKNRRERDEEERGGQARYRGAKENENREQETYEHGGGSFRTAARGAAALIVLCTRLLQIFCCVLMGYMTVIMARSFWAHQGGLGLLQTMVEERNYGLAFYVGFAGVTLLMGVLWCLWILTRKAAGGGIRLKSYDTGRGFLPFLICLAATAAIGAAAPFIPAASGTAEEILTGVRAAFEAVNAHHGTLISASALGAAVSFGRKLLRV